MERIFASPSRYVQGKGVLKHGLSHIKDLGKKVLLLTDETVWKIAGEELFENLKAADLDPVKEIFGGEASANEIDRIVSKAKSESIEVIAALGGGKAIDTGKAVADELKIPIAVLPTIASTDAPTSALSVIYTDEGRFEKYRFYNKNPELVLVDTAVIAKAPAKLLAAGIADALATYVEARAVARSHSKNMVGGVQPIASDIAKKSMLLLKNEGVLPLQKTEKVAIVGPGAHSRDLLGAWSWQGKQEEVVTLVEGAQALGADLLIGQEPFDYFAPSEAAIQEAIELVKAADKVVLALGEQEWMSGEAASRSDIRLPQAQLSLVETLKEYNEQLIVTLYNGRPLDLQGVDAAKAIVEAWFPGTEGGNALAQILWGEYNPSGRLSMSFPETVGQVPVYYNVDNTGRPYESAPDEKYVSKYLDVSNYAKYPFGFGLSYSPVAYSAVTLDQPTMTKDQTVTASITVTNQGTAAVWETVQCYIRDLVGEVVRPVKELKGFKKIWLEAGESATVQFEITEELLRYVHSNQQVSSDPGKFHIMIGGNSRDTQQTTLQLVR